ncbi:MAG TPA: adenosylcobinamide-GDP ribazoletransferase, partial [Bacillota bacterium]|nr:adenosylcobinamide-GDP ribazoletransferase [Bacillota bacterium]
MKLFLIMLQFFTRIPLPLEVAVNPADFPRGVRYFPLVGLIIGFLDALVFWLLTLGLDKSIAVVGVVLFNSCLTGALHLDGLADTCDALFSARDRERMLEIMKDSR